MSNTMHPAKRRRISRLNHDNNQAMSSSNYLYALMSSIHTSNWTQLEYLLRTNPTQFQSVSRAISNSSTLNGMTLLHSALRFHPPAILIQRMVELYPKAAHSVDCLNRTPLHIAAAVRADVRIICILIDATAGMAASVRDADGMTPLHFACDANCELFEGEDGIQREPSSLQVVHYLAMASPQSVPLEDASETSALEYAILSSADAQVVSYLMRFTQCQVSSTVEISKKSIRFAIEPPHSGRVAPNERLAQVPDSKEMDATIKGKAPVIVAGSRDMNR